MINENNFDDLLYANVGGRGQLMPEYSLNSLQNLKEINIKLLSNFIKECNDIIANIKNEELKRGVSLQFKHILKAYEKCNQFNPEAVYSKVMYLQFKPSDCGMDSFDQIVDFINGIFMLSLYYKSEEEVLYSILNLTKELAKKLGILSVPEEIASDLLTNPYSDNYELYCCEYRLDDTNTLYSETGTSITSLPYLFSWPTFKADGSFDKNTLWPVKKGEIWFNQNKFDELVKQNNHELR